MEQIAERTFRDAECAFLGGGEGIEFDGPVAARKSGDGILIRALALEFVGGADIEVQLQLAERGFGNDDGIFGKRDAGAGFAAGLEEKNTVPVSAAGGDIVDIENQVRKTLVEDARLHLKGNLGSDQGGFDVAEGAQAAGREDQRH